MQKNSFKWILISILVLAFLMFAISSISAQEIVWQQSGLSNQDVRSLLATSDGTLYAGTNSSGIFRSKDGGNTWAEANTGLLTSPEQRTPPPVWTLTVSNTMLYAGTWGKGVFRSEDGGNSWKAVNIGLANSSVHALSFLGANLYAGTAGGIFRSENRGDSWTSVKTGLTDLWTHSLAVMGKTIYAGSGKTVFYSVDEGESWTAAKTGVFTLDIYSLAVIGTKIYAGQNGGHIFRSEDGGNSWTLIKSEALVYSFAVFNSTIYAGLSELNGGGVIRSEDGGKTWTAVKTGLTNKSVRALTISGMTLYAGTEGNGIFRTSIGINGVAQPPEVTTPSPTEVKPPTPLKKGVDIAFYIGHTNPLFYVEKTMLQDVDAIIKATKSLFKSVQTFDDKQLVDFAKWIDTNIDDGEFDIIWLPGVIPSVLYPFPNKQPDGSRAETWLDGGNMFINTGDWFGYVSYETGSRAPENGSVGAGNILDLPPEIIGFDEGKLMKVTPTGKKAIPSLQDFKTRRAVHLSALKKNLNWTIAAIIASENGEDNPEKVEIVDPVVLYNKATNGYVAIIHQTSGDNRANYTIDFIKNWVAVTFKDLFPTLPVPEVPTTLVRSFSLSLKRGLNMISLALKPEKPFTAKSFSDFLGSTIVVRHDPNEGKFIAYIPSVAKTTGTEGFPIEGGMGYIVNLLADKEIKFTGQPWGEPISQSPSFNSDSSSFTSDDFLGGIWAFVVSGSLQESNSFTAQPDRVIVKNLRNGLTTTTRPEGGEFQAIFVDLSRAPVVLPGDRLEVVALDENSKRISGPFRFEVQPHHLRLAYLQMQMRLGDIIPEKTRLLANYPNPFNPETWIPYELAEEAEVRLDVYDVSGKLVRSLRLGYKPPGIYIDKSRAIYWNGKNDNGERASSGIYFYRLQAGAFSAVRKMVVVK